MSVLAYRADMAEVQRRVRRHKQGTAVRAGAWKPSAPVGRMRRFGRPAVPFVSDWRDRVAPLVWWLVLVVGGFAWWATPELVAAMLVLLLAAVIAGGAARVIYLAGESEWQ